MNFQNSTVIDLLVPDKSIEISDVLYGGQENGRSREEVLNDISFIRDMKHLKAGAWQQYDVLLAARGYGWEAMVDWAAYMESADFSRIDTLTVSEMMNAGETELIDSYRRAQVGLKEFEELKEELGVLSVGGTSRTLGAPVKIVWFNQTKILRVFTIINDESLMKRYVETMIRRTFGTDDAMKLAQPVPAKERNGDSAVQSGEQTTQVSSDDAPAHPVHVQIKSETVDPKQVKKSFWSRLFGKR